MKSDDPFPSTLFRTWQEYRQCAARSRALKTTLDKARRSILIYLVAGAALGALAVQSKDWNIVFEGFSYFNSLVSMLPRLLSGASAICVGLAALYTRHFLQSSMERNWVMLRSMAESLKSEAFKFMAKTPPYDKDSADDVLSDKAKELLGEVLPGEPVELTEEDKQKGLPNDWLSVDDYIKCRVREQIDEYYNPNTKKNAKKVSRIRQVSFLLGVAGVILGGFAAFQPDEALTAAWVGVVSTISGALAAYLYAGRFEYLSTSYDLTARRLEWLIDDWLRHKRKNPDASPNGFILGCEQAISIENSAWVAEWSKRTEKTKAVSLEENKAT